MSAPAGALAFEPVIGLEVHVELKTKSKIFCACATEFGAPPNTQVCPVCLGLPGVLPVLNRRVVEFAMRAALATGATIKPKSQFARKNYFYPDLAKGYQITQYELSFAYGGALEIEAGGLRRRVGITRLNIEEEAAKSFHGLPEGGEGAEGGCSLIDFNRSGLPLIEIVSEPDLRSPEEARAYLGKLRNMLLFAGVSDCKMQEGALRCDVNVSLRPRGIEALGNLVEVKNLNSFRAVVRALEHEVRRQAEILAAGGRVERETRRWDETGDRTVPMRSKEQAHDYRYFPEPDLPVLRVEQAWIEAVASEMPLLPDARRDRLQREHGLSEYQASQIVADPALADLFDRTVSLLDGRSPAARPQPGAGAAARGAVASEAAVALANWITGDVARLANAAGLGFDALPIGPRHLLDLVGLVESGRISGKMAKDVLEECWRTGSLPSQVVSQTGLEQVSDEHAVAALVDQVIRDHADAVRSFQRGKEQALGFLVGEVMRATRGRANPGLVNRLLRAALEARSRPAGQD